MICKAEALFLHDKSDNCQEYIRVRTKLKKHHNLMNSMEEIRKRYIQSLLEEEKEELAENAANIDRFIKLCAKKGLQLSDKNFSYIKTIGVVANYPNILTYLNSNIIKDKEKLVNCDLLNKNYTKKGFASGYYYDGDYMIMAHPYFRRRFNENANYAPRFIDLFWGLKKQDLELYLAIDFNRVRINLDDSFYRERDTWFGAGFNKKISDISNGISKYRPPLDLERFDISFFFNDAYSLITSWASKDGIKTFQAEEYKTEEVKLTRNGEVFYPVRYIHAEFDLNKGWFRHFDGAVHLYNESDYYQMRDADLNYNSKERLKIKADSQKLFKMNGVIDVDTWILYSSHFFTGNPLIIEYFEGKYPAHITDMIVKVRANRTN